MIYTLNLLYSLWCSDRLSYIYEHSNIRKNIFSFFLMFTPMWLVWLLICGGQYEVGADYYSYYSIFENVEAEYYYSKGEWFFASVISMGHNIGISPQGMFFVFYFINFFFFLRATFLLERKYIYIWILLFITLSTVFNNQLNGLRQYSAIYILTFGFISFFENRSYWRCLFWIVIAGGIHASSYLSLPFLFLLHRTNIKKHILYILILFSSFFSLFGSFDWLSNIIGSSLPPHYAIYLNSNFNNSNEFIKVVTKLLFVPFYLFSVQNVDSKVLTDKDRYLYHIGILAYIVRLFFLENFIFNRIGQLFVLMAVLPLYVYMKYLSIKRRRNLLWFMILLLFFFYLSKTVVFPSGEYLYQSIYFR